VAIINLLEQDAKCITENSKSLAPSYRLVICIHLCNQANNIFAYESLQTKPTSWPSSCRTSTDCRPAPLQCNWHKSRNSLPNARNLFD